MKVTKQQAKAAAVLERATARQAKAAAVLERATARQAKAAAVVERATERQQAKAAALERAQANAVALERATERQINAAAGEKVTERQANAAALYWTLILTRALRPCDLQASPKNLPFFDKLTEDNTVDTLKKRKAQVFLDFKNDLSQLIQQENIIREDNTAFKIELSFPDNRILILAIDMSKNHLLSWDFFPKGNLSMHFDKTGEKIIVDGKDINVADFLQKNTSKLPEDPPSIPELDDAPKMYLL